MFGTLVMLTLAAGTADAGNPLDQKAEGMTAADASQLVALGDLYVEAERLAEAKNAYMAALKLQPKYGEAEFGLARIDMAKGNLEKSKQTCRTIARKNKDEAVGEICSGWVWLSFDRSARAIDEFNKAVAKGDHARGKTGLGEAHRRLADDAAAIDMYNQAVAAGSGYLARMGLGLTYESRGDVASALAALKEAVNLEPASCMAHYHYGRILGKGAEAVAELTVALEIRPEWPQAREELGNVLLQNGDFAGAQKAFEGALSGKVKQGTAYLGLGKAFYGLQKTAEAKKNLELSIELVPNLVDAYLLIADIEYAAGATDAALASLEKAKAMAPGVVKVYLHTGETYFRLGRYTSANSFLNQAVTMKPDLSVAYVILGDIACERHLFDAGQAHYEKALKGDLEGVDAAEIEKRRSQCKSKFGK
jgi:tetratricopeptide (TPR) repeat protein